MGKALDVVMDYAYEDVASIHKHWIIFVKKTIEVLARAVIAMFVYFKLKLWIETIADIVNSKIPEIPFEIKKIIFPLLLLYLAYKTIRAYVEGFIEYKTVRLSINNIQIKGKSGLYNVGIVNAPIENVERVEVTESFWGRVFHYGTISIVLGGRQIIMNDMVDVEAFQDGVILMQETKKEGRDIRNFERQASIVEAQTKTQFDMIKAISKNKIDALEVKECETIEDKNK